MNIDYLLYVEYILHIMIFSLILGGLGIWIYLVKDKKIKYNYALSPILFLSHALLFSILTSLNLIPEEIYIIWRDLIFIHALIIFCSTGIIFVKIKGGKK